MLSEVNLQIEISGLRFQARNKVDFTVNSTFVETGKTHFIKISGTYNQ